MIEQFYDLRPDVLELDRKALELCREPFRHVEEIRDYNQLKMLRAFTDCGVEARHFWGSSGYGVWDDSRNKLEEVFARCMGAEAALVRSQFMSGTHTLTVALFGLLRTGDTLLAATGRPYDTLEGVIGIGEAGKGCGTLREYGVNYDECPLLPDNTPDYALIAEKAKTATVVHIQRSRGYMQRNAFDLETIRRVAETARKANPDAVIFVDNCYGEFTQTLEPLAAGADLIAGSFIKNPGGGITPTGGYIARRLGLHPGQPAGYLPGFLLRPRRRVRGPQDRYLRPVPAGAGGGQAGAPLHRRPQRHRDLFRFRQCRRPHGLLRRYPAQQPGGQLR